MRLPMGRKRLAYRPPAQLDEQLGKAHADENPQRNCACERERLHAAQGERLHVTGDERIRRVIDARAGTSGKMPVTMNTVEGIFSAMDSMRESSVSTMAASVVARNSPIGAASR